mgnify:CR=1 FL=1
MKFVKLIENVNPKNIDSLIRQTKRLEKSIDMRLTKSDLKNIELDMKLSTDDFIESTLNFIDNEVYC